MLFDVVDDRPPEWPRGQTYHVGSDGRRNSSADGWDDYKRALGWGEAPKFVQDRLVYAGQQGQPEKFYMSYASEPMFDISQAVRHLSMYGDLKTREAMEKILRPPMVRSAIPEASWRNLRDGLAFRPGSIMPGAVTYVGEPRRTWSSWSDLAEQIAAGASPLQLIVAPGGVDRTGI